MANIVALQAQLRPLRRWQFRRLRGHATHGAALEMPSPQPQLLGNVTCL